MRIHVRTNVFAPALACLHTHVFRISGVPTLVQNTGHHQFLLGKGYLGSFTDTDSFKGLLKKLQSDVGLLRAIQIQGTALAEGASPLRVAQKYAWMFQEVLSCKNAWKRAFFFDLFGKRIHRFQFLDEGVTNEDFHSQCVLNNTAVLQLDKPMVALEGRKYSGPAHSRCSIPVEYVVTDDGQRGKREWQANCPGTDRVAPIPIMEHEALEHPEMVVTELKGDKADIRVSFSNQRNEEKVATQQVRRDSLISDKNFPNVEIHMLDSVTRAVFQFRMLLTGVLLREFAASDKGLCVFQFRHFHTVGIHTRGNVPTLWQGCSPPQAQDLEHAHFRMIDCQTSLGKHFSDIGYVVAVSTVSRELWTVPKRDLEGELCRNTALIGSESCIVCLQEIWTSSPEMSGSISARMLCIVWNPGSIHGTPPICIEIPMETQRVASFIIWSLSIFVNII